MVGILKPSSVPKAATILDADDPEAALTQNEHNFDQDGIEVVDDIPDEAREKVAANNELMRSMGYFATPTILYKKDSDEVSVKQGLPQGGEVRQILGGPRP